MSYVPPQKRGTERTVTKLVKKEEFPELSPVKANITVPETKMNFASLFKKAFKKKNRVKKLKWGTVLLTKNGVIDSLTQEERDEEETWKNEAYQESHLRKVSERLQKSQDLRREYDPHYESPEECPDSESEEEEEEDEVELFTEDEEEDEFEPEI